MLPVGRRLGPYEIVSLIGTGGMGEVYRARDPRLGRDVALKVIRGERVEGADGLRRFEREARATASLNHPGILTVHDVGTDGGTAYVVTELLEGETLREACSSRAPTQRQIVAWAVQVAQGLAAAHQKGIVHRDLKPENLFLTADGRVKILDFGLAKRTEAVGAGDGEATEQRSTRPGTLMGTVAYMSPEQVRALGVDARSDVFSFGVVLYELLSRRHPFQRKTVAATLTAILQDTPAELSSVDPAIPAALGGMVRRCLEKEKEDRFQSAHDLALALEAVLATPSGAPSLRDVEERSPYPGLASFTERDAAVFFGREAEVKALWQRLESRRLLAVIGPSGAGKTSFLRAGVIPARPEGWGAVRATPGARPALGLAQSLTPELAGDAEAVADLLRGVSEVAESGESEWVVSAVKRWRSRHGDALLVVDQFEELFTLCPEETQRRFAALLGRLASEADVHVVLSLRDDFLIRCSEHEPLAPVFESLTPLPGLTPDGLRRALVEPAKKRGYGFEDEALVDEMVESVEGARGALPLLAFAVARLWEKRDRERKLFTRAAYDEIAGVAGALAQHAEATMDRIGTERQVMVREIFRNLVTSQGTRAVAEREELLSAFPQKKDAEQVLRELIDARLLTAYEVAGKEGEPSHHRIEVVHESLLKAWPRLVRWQMQDEEGAVLRDQLRQAAHLWEEKGRTSDLLWSGTAYQEYVLWRDRYAGALTALEEDFARAMREKARRRKRLVRAAVAAVVLASTVVAIAVAVSRHQAVRARQQAEEEARRAEASKLLALGQVEIDAYPTAALAYTTKGLEISDTPEGRLQALRVLWKAPPARVLTMPEGESAAEPAFSRDGRWLATTGMVPPNVVLFAEDGRFVRRLTDEGAQGPPRIPFAAFGGDAVFWWTGSDRARAWTLDGRSFPAFDGLQFRVTGSDEGAYTVGPAAKGRSGTTLQEWSVSRGVTRLIRSLPLAPDESPDPGFVRLVRNAGPALHVRPLPRQGAPGPAVLVGRHRAFITYTATAPGAERVLSIDRSGEWRVWSTERRRLLALRRPPSPHAYSAALFDRVGSRIVWSSSEGWATYVWNLDDPPDAELLRLRTDQTGADMSAPTFDARGHWMAASYGYQSVTFWPLGLPHARVLPGHTQTVSYLRFTSDSRYLVSGGRDGVRIWPLRLGEGTQRRVDIGSDYYCYGADVSPRGETAAFAASLAGLFLVEGSAHAPRRVLRPEPGTFFENAAFDSTGRRLATVEAQWKDLDDHVIRDVDLDSGAARTWRYREREGSEPLEAPSIGFAWDGRLVLGGNHGVFHWKEGVDRPTALLEAPGKFVGVTTTPDGRWLAAVVGRRTAQLAASWDVKAGEAIVFDLTKGSHWPVPGHGSDVQFAALDASGSLLVTGDSAGTVRVGSASGGVPHLLVGHSTGINAIAVSPDRKWIASAAGADIRLWPMPDLAKPPLQTLPHGELMAKLQALTNLRVVEDPAAATGYRLEVGPFPGWKDAPAW